MQFIKFPKYLVLVLLLIIGLAGCTGKTDQSKDNLISTIQTAERDQLEGLIGKDFLIDEMHSYVGFKIKYFGFSPVRGRFDDYNGTAFYDPSDLRTLSVTLIIDVSTINTGQERRDNDLLTEGGSWFNVTDHPYIKFSSTGVSNISEDGFTLHGTLSLNGVTKSIEVPFEKPTAMSKDWSANDQVDYSGRLTIDRTEYGVQGDGFWNTIMENGLTQLSEDVEIELDIHTQRFDYPARYENEDSTNVRVIIPDMIRDEGLEKGLDHITALFNQADSPITSGAMSTIGYTLLHWDMPDEAYDIFNKRLELFPGRFRAYDQMGIALLWAGKLDEAKESFRESLKKDSINSRPTEYLKLIKRLRE